MKKFISILLVVMMVFTFAACGGGSSSAEKEDPAEREMVAAMDQASTVLDMHGTNALADYLGIFQIYDTLLIKNAQNEIEGSLADSWTVSDDGKTYTFKLKEGVKFSNGEEMTADDVVWSLTRGKESSFSSFNFSTLDSVTAVDTYTVEIKLSQANVAFLETLTGANAAIGCKAVFDEAGDNFGRGVDTVVGTGPYILTEWNPGQLMVLTANEDYFKGAPNVKKLRIKTISDTNSAVIALQTGDIDYYFTAIPAVSRDSVESDENLTITDFSSNKSQYLSLNTESDVFSNKLMRQALACGVDRQKMLTIGLDDQGVIANTLAGADYTAVPSDFEWYEYDLEKAKSLVKEAGMEGASVTIKTYSIGAYSKIATALQDDLKQLGLNAEVQQLEVNAMIADLESGNFQIAVTGWVSSVKDTGDVFNLILNSDNYGSTNDARYKSSEVDKILEEAMGEQDNAKRTEMYKQVAEIVKEDCPYIPLFYTSENRAYTSDLTIDEGNVQYNRIYDFSWNY